MNHRFVLFAKSFVYVSVSFFPASVHVYIIKQTHAFRNELNTSNKNVTVFTVFFVHSLHDRKTVQFLAVAILALGKK